MIAGLVAIIFMGGTRLAFRLRHERSVRSQALSSKSERKILLVGAGEAGALFARELRRNPQAAMTAMGFVDDDPNKRRDTVAGLPVLGTIADLPTVCKEHVVDEVLISMPS